MKNNLEKRAELRENLVKMARFSTAAKAVAGATLGAAGVTAANQYGREHPTEYSNNPVAQPSWLNRNGSEVGGVAGGAIGGAIGALLGPVGMLAGGFIGDQLGRRFAEGAGAETSRGKYLREKMEARYKNRARTRINPFGYLTD